MSIKNLFNPIKENGVHIKLNDYKIFELLHHQQAEGDKGTDNTLEEDLVTILFNRTEKLQSLSIIISMLDVENVDEYAIYKILHDIH